MIPPASSPPRPRHPPPWSGPPDGISDSALPALPVLVVLLATGLLAACSGEEAALRVDGVAFGEEELRGYTPGTRRALAALTAVGVAVAEGDTLGPAAPVLEDRRRAILGRRLREEAALERAGVDDEMLRTHYLSNPGHELTVRHVLFLSERGEDEERRRLAREKAERALERLRAGEPFPRIAAELSEEPGAEGREGLLRPGREGTWVEPFWRAASLLDVGEVSHVVETRYGYHVLRLERRDTVPFEEVRPEVAREVASLLPGPPAEADRWADSHVGEIVVHPAAVASWMEARNAWTGRLAGEAACPSTDPSSGASGGSGAAGPGGTPETDGSEAADLDGSSSAAIATWNGGGIGPCALERHLATLPYGEWRRATGSAEALGGEVRELARATALAQAARERGLRVPEAEIAVVRRAWRDRIARWAAVLGFRPGMDADEVKASALESLGSTGQERRVARDEIRERIPLLLYAYPLSGTALGGG